MAESGERRPLPPEVITGQHTVLAAVRGSAASARTVAGAVTSTTARPYRCPCPWSGRGFGCAVIMCSPTACTSHWVVLR